MVSGADLVTLFVLILTAVGSAVLALMLTATLRRRLEKARVLDHPNTRSLHARAVPRGGGLAIAMLVLSIQLVLIATGWLAPITGLLWWLVGAAFATLGWCDDIKPRAASVRLLVQCLLAVVFVLSAAPDLFVSLPLVTRCGGVVMVSLLLVWTVNLFNFMDGADGFAASQTVLAMSVGALALWLLGHNGPALVAAATAGAALGFLRWNWHPATIFMGDSGSYFLGFQFAALALSDGGSTPMVCLWVLLLLPFIVDASATLLLRVVRGKPVWQAHREHLYQRLVLGGWLPTRLVATLLAVNVVLCWPFALLVLMVPDHATKFVVLAVLLNAALWLVIRRRPASPVRSHAA